jgi:hypothetical protein
MLPPTPSLQEWENLYQAAIRFKKIACWDWMSDADLFGVQNPANGVIGYCCVMGKFKELLGLVVYLGTEGLAGYTKIQSNRSAPDAVHFLHFQTCLTLTFEGRKDLREPDLTVIKRLGLKFRGQQDWPLFRNYEPGYLPWYIGREEVLFLATLIPQVIEVSSRVRSDPNLLRPPRENSYLVRVPEKVGEATVWREERREPTSLEKAELAVPPVDELHLQKIKNSGLGRQGLWEIDQFHSPAVVDEGGRPYFPYVFLWVDHDTGLVLNVQVTGLVNYESDFQHQFMGLMEKVKVIPEEIWLQNEEPVQLLKPIASRLGIKLTRVNRLPALKMARDSLFSFFEKE